MPEIYIEDGLDPETTAMLQALYSRSPRSVTEHLEQVRKSGAAAFMQKFYVNYGHKSIGDCGSTTLFFENVSILAAKALQDHPLYNGQEASTRYLDFSGRKIVSPLDSVRLDSGRLDSVRLDSGRESLDSGREAKPSVLSQGSDTPGSDTPGSDTPGSDTPGAIQAEWMALYEKTLPLVRDSLIGNTKSVKIRAFDICRSLLPAGMTTFVSMHMTLSGVAEHLKWLRNHPLAEVRSLAEQAHAALFSKYPPSFGHKRYQAQEDFYASQQQYFFREIREFSYSLGLSALSPTESLAIGGRPEKTELPHSFRMPGLIRFSFPLDYGSWRDLQRHRSCVQQAPLLTSRLGFESWYLDRMPAPVAEEVARLTEKVNSLECSDTERQYYLPLGYRVPVVIGASLPSCVYISDLRSGETVHPTLRIIAQRMAVALEVEFPGIALYTDTSEDKISVKRGTQDIVEAG